MRTYYLENNAVLVSKELVVGNIRYPANLWPKLGEDKLASLGITWEDITVIPKPDSRYYWGYMPDGSLNPKNIEDEVQVDTEGNEHLVVGLKTLEIAKVKAVVNSYLSETDWMVSRLTTRNIAIPINIRAFRDAIVDSSEVKEELIASCTNVDELKALFTSTEDFQSVMNEWPKEDDDFTTWVPKTITKLQAIEQLELDGKLGSFVQLLGADLSKQIRWDSASILDRNNILLELAAPLLEIDLDDFFRKAVAI